MIAARVRRLAAAGALARRSIGSSAPSPVQLGLKEVATRVKSLSRTRGGLFVFGVLGLGSLGGVSFAFYGPQIRAKFDAFLKWKGDQHLVGDEVKGAGIVMSGCSDGRQHNVHVDAKGGTVYLAGSGVKTLFETLTIADLQHVKMVTNQLNDATDLLKKMNKGEGDDHLSKVYDIIKVVKTLVETNNLPSVAFGESLLMFCKEIQPLFEKNGKGGQSDGLSFELLGTIFSLLCKLDAIESPTKMKKGCDSEIMWKDVAIGSLGFMGGWALYGVVSVVCAIKKD